MQSPTSPLWIVSTTASHPCAVCSISILLFALLPTFLILSGLANGTYEFELDTNPASFRVVGDSIADRGDAFFVFLDDFSTDESPLLNRWGPEPEVEGKFEQTNEERGYEYLHFHTAITMFEFHDNKPFQKGGIPKTNAITSSALHFIDLFERGVRQLPSYPIFCERKFNTAHLPPSIDNCVDEFEVTPTILLHAVELEPSRRYPKCCDCFGEPSFILPRHTCLSTPICLADRVTSNGAFGDSQSASQVVLDPLVASTTLIDDPAVLTSLAESSWCDSPAIQGAAFLKELFDGDFSRENAMAHTTRNYFKLGKPFQTNGTITRDFRNDAYDATRDGMKAFVLDELIPWTAKVNNMVDNPLRIAQMTGFHLSYEIGNVIGDASFWAMFSFIFVTGYVWFHTRSLFLTALGQVHVLLSFPTTWFIYRVVFGIEYMGFLNFISLFVILGIGADDIFVFVDAWKQSRLEPPEISGSLVSRLDWTYRRAAGAMLITSLTDAGAFYANLFSNITVVRIFGLFMGTLVVVNFLLVITYFPAVVVLHHKLGWEPKLKEDEKPQRARMETFFSDTFAPKILQTVSARKIVVAISLFFVLVMGGVSTTLEVAKKDFRADSFPPDSNMMRALDSLTRFDGNFLSNPQVDFIIGMGSDGEVAINRDGTDTNNPKDLGKANTVTTGDEFENLVSEGEVQSFLIDVCDILATTELISPYTLNDVEGGVYCAMKHYKRWVEHMGMTYPVPKEEFIPLLMNFTSMIDYEDVRCQEDEQCVAWWTSLLEFPSAWSEFFNDFRHRMWRWLFRWDAEGGACEEGRECLRGLRFTFNITMDWDIGGAEAWEAFDSVEKSALEVNKKALELTVVGGEKLQGFQVTFQDEGSGSKWSQIRTDEVMRQTAIFGCVVSCIAVFIILIGSTANWILASLSTLVIFFIIVCCIGFVTLAFDASFGFMEAICVCICVGFSIDFVAHLAIAYMEADVNLGRYERVRKSLTDLGVSITGACLTTFGAAVFMTPNSLIPIMKMGWFIMFDITVSLFFAVGIFSALLVQFGPKKREGGEGETGSVNFLSRGGGGGEGGKTAKVSPN